MDCFLVFFPPDVADIILEIFSYFESKEVNPQEVSECRILLNVSQNFKFGGGGACPRTP
jgi:hypothetical protein